MKENLSAARVWAWTARIPFSIFQYSDVVWKGTAKSDPFLKDTAGSFEKVPQHECRDLLLLLAEIPLVFLPN